MMPEKWATRLRAKQEQRQEQLRRTGVSVPHGRLLFLRCGGTADFLDGWVRRGCGAKRPGYEEVVVVEIAIHASGNLGGLGAVGGTSTAQEDYRYDASDVGLGVGGEPSVAGAGMGAGSGFAEDGFLVKIQAYAAGGAVFDRAGHAV